MAEKSVTLKHVVRRDGKQAVFFYDGAATAEDGLLTLPADRPEWIKRAWLSGYNMNPQNDARLSTWAEVEELINSQGSKRAKDSTESTEVSSEDSSAGRQPGLGDGVRESKQESSASVTESRSRSSGGGSVNDGKTAQARKPIALDADKAAGGRQPPSDRYVGKDVQEA